MSQLTIQPTVKGYDWLLRHYAIKSADVTCLLVENTTVKFVCKDFYLDYKFANNEFKEYFEEESDMKLTIGENKTKRRPNYD